MADGQITPFWHFWCCPGAARLGRLWATAAQATLTYGARSAHKDFSGRPTSKCSRGTARRPFFAPFLVLRAAVVAPRATRSHPAFQSLTHSLSYYQQGPHSMARPHGAFLGTLWALARRDAAWLAARRGVRRHAIGGKSDGDPPLKLGGLFKHGLGEDVPSRTCVPAPPLVRSSWPQCLCNRHLCSAHYSTSPLTTGCS